MNLITPVHRLALRACYHRRTHSTAASKNNPLTLSYVEGPTEPPLDYRTLPAYWDQVILKNWAARPALVCKQERARAHGGPTSHNLGVDGHLAWDFAEFDRHVRALARGLVGLGVKKGDRVGVIMGNNSAYAMLQWACASVGAILVTMNPAYRLSELVNTLSLVGVSHLFVVPRIRSSAYVRMLRAAFPSIVTAAPGAIEEESLPSLRHLVVVENVEGEGALKAELRDVRCAVDFREILVWGEKGSEEREVKRLREGLDRDEVANLQFTSGTTGAPKAVSLTHHNLLNNGLSIGKCMRLGPSDILCNVPPLFHCFVLGNLAAWSHGACIVYPSQIFDPVSIVDTITQEKCTALHGVPTHFLGVLQETEKRVERGEHVDFSALRTGIAAGSSIPTELMKKLIDKLNLKELTIAYGMTETSPVSFQTTTDDPILKRVETVGRVQPHVKAKIVDPTGNILQPNKPGELLVAGYLLQKGYWEDKETTSKVMKEDENGTLWMSTGDEGIMDEEGYLKIVGRIKDLIIRGGENLFPVQIENVLTAHTGIVEAAVVAVPDKQYGEVVGAWVVRNPHMADLSREEVRKFVAENMNPQNAPAWVWFVGEDGEEMPKTASGKVMKHVLRDWSKKLAAKGVGNALQ